MNEVLLAVSDGTRHKLLERIALREICACELPAFVGVSQPAISQHLKVLLEAQLVSVKRDGRKRIYSITPKGKTVLRDVSRW